MEDEERGNFATVPGRSEGKFRKGELSR